MAKKSAGKMPAEVKASRRKESAPAATDEIDLSSVRRESPWSHETFPLAVGKLFELSNYSVEYGKHLHGAQIDIVAIPKGVPYAQNIYIEATIQYVDNTKYGKDLTKFSLIREKEPHARCISVSVKGFTAEVKERALNTRIITQTYDELFAEFEKFDAYVVRVLESKAVIDLIPSYEQPFFEDDLGKQMATDWLSDWRFGTNSNNKWIVVLGEYGTGKTSLTIALQHRWLLDYKAHPESPIPIRIELRNFSRQFDARSLLHHFLDNNALSHIPIEFMIFLIRSGRVLLLLDGYDEMAQFLNARERRACLSALAELAAEGARGILTSRPNYFTVTEELNVFDALYTSLEQNKYFLTRADRLFLAEEQSIDSLVKNYVLERRERYLRDLDEAQTEALVRRKLLSDPDGQSLILSMLRRIFRDEVFGSKRSLGGKPVIISYLLEIIDELRRDQDGHEVGQLTEWQVYKLIVDRLMFRDFQRTPTLDPNTRRIGLQRLAMILSNKDTPSADESIFFSIIDDVCKSELRRLSADERRIRREELFQNLRSSATLTRSETGNFGWMFSHNSLREYLVAEHVIGRAITRQQGHLNLPISAAMRAFVASIHLEGRQEFINSLRDLWQARVSAPVSQYISIGWELLRRAEGGLLAGLRYLTGSSPEGSLNLSAINLERVELSATVLDVHALPISFSRTSVSESIFVDLDLSGATFLEELLIAFSSGTVFWIDATSGVRYCSSVNL